MKPMKKLTALALACALGLSACAGPGGASSHSAPRQDFTSVPPGAGSTQEGAPAQAMRYRSMWFSYLEWPMLDTSSAEAFTASVDTVLDHCVSLGLNCITVQVRPFADATYESELFPWSHVVTGTQGQAPGFDPLEIFIARAHEKGLAFEAWVNPYRVRLNETRPPNVAENSLENTHPEWVKQAAGGAYLEPSNPDVQAYICKGVEEIVKNYAVDGIQFDDYFYPSEDPAFDEGAYNAYVESVSRSGKPLELLEWRQANINAMVSLTYSEIKSVNPDVQFGISPQVNVSNDLKMGADVESWCSVRGYVDYICPQLYVNFENPVLPYDVAAEQWREMTTDPNVKLYFGLAVYKAGSDADGGTWKKADNILAQQVALGRQVKCDGFMFYSCEYLDHDQTRKEMENVMKQFAG